MATIQDDCFASVQRTSQVDPPLRPFKRPLWMHHNTFLLDSYRSGVPSCHYFCIHMNQKHSPVLLMSTRLSLKPMCESLLPLTEPLLPVSCMSSMGEEPILNLMSKTLTHPSPHASTGLSEAAQSASLTLGRSFGVLTTLSSSTCRDRARRKGQTAPGTHSTHQGSFTVGSHYTQQTTDRKNVNNVSWC